MMLVTLNGFIVAQLLIFYISSIASIVLLGFADPYKIKSKNKDETNNEIITMVIMYHAFLFTDFVGDELTRRYIGHAC